MVARGEADVFCTACLNGSHPSAGIEAMRIESLCRFGVFMTIDARVHIPFTLGKHGVETPMQEHTEACVAKLFARLQVFCGRDISGLGTGTQERAKEEEKAGEDVFHGKRNVLSDK